MQRQKKKRIGLRIVGAILLLAAVALGVLWYLDYQERPKLVDGVQYQVPYRADHAEVVGCDPEAASLVIRSEYRGKPVTRITMWAFKGSRAETIEIPSTIKTLDDAALAGSGIRTIEIPAWVNEIDDRAFQDCAALEAVTMLGNPAIKGRPFENCPALRSLTLTRPRENQSLDLFVDCPVLSEIHLPASWPVDRYAQPPEGATLFVRDKQAAQVALYNGWPCAPEPDSGLRIMSLADALAGGEASWRVEGDGESRRAVAVNETPDALVLALNHETAPTDLEADGCHFFFTDDDFSTAYSKVLALEPGGSDLLTQEYYTGYGPGEMKLDLVSTGEYVHFTLLKGALEIAEAVDLAPNERQTIALPAGRYGIMYGYGKSPESAKKGAEEGPASHTDGYRNYPADGHVELSVYTGNPYRSYLYRTPFDQYGPGTSKLYLRRMDGTKTCYRLYRVGGGLEFEAKLFDTDANKTVSFPSGTYILRIARGSEWISDEEAFGPNGRYSVIYYQSYKPGETYEITTTTGSGNVMSDSAGNF